MRVKVYFYMKSGNVVTMKFKEFECSKLSGTNDARKMTWSGSRNSFTLDVEELEAVVIKRVLW